MTIDERRQYIVRGFFLLAANFALFVIGWWAHGALNPAPAPQVITAPARIAVTFPKDGVVDIETDRCWIIVNIKKRSTYHECRGEQTGSTDRGGL